MPIVVGSPVDIPHEPRHSSCGISTGGPPRADKLDILQGTLDLMVLRTLATLGPLHGYGIARRIEQVSGDHVILNQGTIYTSLVRLEQRGWIRSKWGVSENNRRARFYTITRAGEKQLVGRNRELGAGRRDDGPRARRSEDRTNDVLAPHDLVPAAIAASGKTGSTASSTKS